MSSYSTREIRNALIRKGFRQDNTHHYLFWLYIDGQKTPVRTRLSHGLREYGDNLLGAVAREMSLRRRELDAFIECPLSYQAYIEILIERSVL